MRSNWIISQIDICGWAHSFGGEHGDNIVKTRRGVYILLLLSPLADVSQEIRDKYWSWIEDIILTPIKEENPDLYSWIIEWYQKEFADIINKDYIKEETT